MRGHVMMKRRVVDRKGRIEISDTTQRVRM